MNISLSLRRIVEPRSEVVFPRRCVAVLIKNQGNQTVILGGAYEIVPRGEFTIPMSRPDDVLIGSVTLELAGGTTTDGQAARMNCVAQFLSEGGVG